MQTDKKFIWDADLRRNMQRMDQNWLWHFLLLWSSDLSAPRTWRQVFRPIQPPGQVRWP